MTDKYQKCANCDGIMENLIGHNCIRGLTDNINRLHSDMYQLIVKRIDHLDGLKYALKIIDETEQHYKYMGTTYEDEGLDPFHDLRNKIRMLLGLRFVERKL